MAFKKTQEQLYAMRASEEFGRGIHRSTDVQQGTAGFERIFDSRTRASDIRHHSVRGMVSGVPHSKHGTPLLPMSINLVIDARSGSEDSERVQAVKIGLMRKLGESLLHASPAVSDDFQIFAIGGAPKERFLKRVAQPIDAKDLPAVSAEGVTMLASDFHGLDLGSFRMRNTVGIDIKHPGELEIPANVGTIRLSGGLKVNTNKPKSLDPVNEMLAARQAELVTSLTGSGLLVSTVVLDPSMLSGFDERAADISVASNLKSLMVR